MKVYVKENVERKCQNGSFWQHPNSFNLENDLNIKAEKQSENITTKTGVSLFKDDTDTVHAVNIK